MFASLQDRCAKILCDTNVFTFKQLNNQLNHMCFNKVLEHTSKADFRIWKHRFAFVAVEIKKDEIEDIYAELTLICGDAFIDVWLKKHDEDEYTILTYQNDDLYEYYFEYCKTNGLINYDEDQFISDLWE